MIYVTIGTLLLLAVVCLSVLIRHRSDFITLFVLTPLLVFSIGFTWYTAQSMMGYPSTTIPVKSRLLYGVVDKPSIYLLVEEQDSLRLHKIAWTEKREQKLTTAMHRIQDGQLISAERDERNNDEIDFDRYDLSEQMPKSETQQ